MSDNAPNTKIRVNPRQRYSTITRPPEMMVRQRRESIISMNSMPDDDKAKTTLFDKFKKMSLKKKSDPRERAFSGPSRLSSFEDLSTSPTPSSYHALDVLGEGVPNTNDSPDPIPEHPTEVSLSPEDLLGEGVPNTNALTPEALLGKGVPSANTVPLQIGEPAPVQNAEYTGPKKTKTALDAINEDLNKYKAAQKLAAKSEKKKKIIDTGSSMFQFRKKNKQQDDEMHDKIRAALAITEESTTEEGENTSGDGAPMVTDAKKLIALDTITEDMSSADKTNAKSDKNKKKFLKKGPNKSIQDFSDKESEMSHKENEVSRDITATSQDPNTITPRKFKSFKETASSILTESKVVDRVQEGAKNTKEARLASVQAPSYILFRNTYMQRKSRAKKKRIVNTTNTSDLLVDATCTSSYQKWKKSSAPRAFGSPYEVTFPQLISDSSDSSDEETNNRDNTPYVVSTMTSSNTAQNTGLSTNNSETPFVAQISYYDSSDSEQCDSGVELPNKTVHFVAVITAHSESESDEESSVEETLDSSFDRSKIPVRLDKSNGLFIQSNRNGGVEKLTRRGTARRPFPCHKEWRLTKITNKVFGSKYTRSSSSDNDSSKSSGNKKFSSAGLSIIENNKKMKLKPTTSKPNDKPAQSGRTANIDQEIASTLTPADVGGVAGAGMQR